MNPLVSGEWLAGHLDEVRVVDTRWYLDGRSGLAAYQAGHIPGAVWLDIDADLSDPPSTAAGRHPLPSPERFAAALGRAGIAEGTPVVAYDDAGGSIAARLWWLLHVLDEPVAVLDGGLMAWPGDLTTDSLDVVAVDRRPRRWPRHFFMSADDIADISAEDTADISAEDTADISAEDTATTHAAILDARTAERYAAGDPKIDPRPGHVPGARSAPWAENLDVDGRFRPADALGKRFAALAGEGPIVAYCGSGVTACHDLLAATIAGRDGLALYTGSWSQWGADPSRPAETGADRGRA